MKIWKTEKTKEAKPKPYLRLATYEYSKGALKINVVDVNGKYIAGICCTSVPKNGGIFDNNSKAEIAAAGYSTSWAQWDDNGRFVKMLEDIEE